MLDNDKCYGQKCKDVIPKNELGVGVDGFQVGLLGGGGGGNH